MGSNANIRKSNTYSPKLLLSQSSLNLDKNDKTQLKKVIGFKSSSESISTRQSSEGSSRIIETAASGKYVLSEGNTNNEPKIRTKKTSSFYAKSKSLKTSSKNPIQLLQQIKPTANEVQLLIKILSNHCIFKHLNKKSFLASIDTFSKLPMKSEDIVYSQYTKPDYFYIVENGKFAMIKSEDENENGNEEKMINESNTFGEWEILNNTIRKETVICKEDGTLWSCSKEQFIEMIQLIRNNETDNIKAYLTQELNITGGVEDIITRGTSLISFKEKTIINTSPIGKDHLFLIKKGEISVIDHQTKEEVKRIGKGILFGFRELYCNSSIVYDHVTMSEECDLYFLPYSHLKCIPEYSHPIDITYTLISKCFKESEVLKDIKQSELDKMLPLFTVKYYSKGDVVFKKAECIENYIIVLLEGNILNYNIKLDASIQGHILYESEIYSKGSILLSNNLTAAPDCVIAVAEINQIEKAIGGTIKDIVDKQLKIKLLKSIHVFSGLSNDKIENIGQMMVYRKFDSRFVIVRQGEKSEFFYLIKSGCVDFYNGDQYTKSYNTNQFFGERSLYLNEPFHLSAISNGKVELYLLNNASFNHMKSPSFLSYIKRQVSIEDYSVELSDLEQLQELGRGAFGSVNLVQSKKTGEKYAIKALNINTFRAKKMEAYIETENRILFQLDHPLIMKLVKVFDQDSYVFLLLEYLKGKTLEAIIQQDSRLTKTHSQLYIACLLEIIDYLHSKRIVYRDLKPSNVIITEKGKLKLIDFGIAKELKRDKTATVIGTPSYMAPEVIKGEPYGLEVDYWSLGICLYECYCGTVPFANNKKDPVAIYKSILEEPLTFPSNIKEKQFTSLVTKLLNKNGPRLANSSSIRKEEWFNLFNWTTFENDLKQDPYTSYDLTGFSKQRQIKKGKVMYLDYVKNFKADIH